jgi:hypothetical protein
MGGVACARGGEIHILYGFSGTKLSGTSVNA